MVACRSDTVALLFPGQGAEQPGMGLWAASRSRAAEDLLALAGRLVGVDARDVLRRGDPRLRRTEVLQPLMTAVCLAIHEVLVAAGVTGRWVAGHSLGELAAWSAAGGIVARDAVMLAVQRGRAMGAEARARPGAMLALTGCNEAELGRALAMGRSRGVVALAAHNAPDEWVVSGERPPLQAIAAAFPSTWLPTSGAWHSPLMQGAVAALSSAFAELELRPTRVAMVCAQYGRIVSDGEIRAALVGQLTEPVRWASCIETLVEHGMTHAITVGPGKQLRGLMRRNAPGVRVLGTESVEDLERIIEELAS